MSQDQVSMSLLEIWYRLAAPPTPPLNAPLYQREIVRRAQIISLVMLLTLFLAALPLFFGAIAQVIPTLIVVLLVDIVALLFNRAGKITIAGWIIVLSSQLGLIASMASTIFTGGLEVTSFEFVCIFIQPIVVAASVLRPKQSLIIFLINCILLPIMVLLAPHSPALTTFVHSSTQSLQYFYVIPLTVFGIGYSTLVIWVWSANSAIHRADAADRKIKLIEKQAIISQIESDQKKILEHDLLELQTAMAALSNPFHANEPLHIAETSTLRSLSTGLEVWRRRSQQNVYERQRLQKLQESMSLLSAFLGTNQPLQAWRPTNTEVDRLAYDILKYNLRASAAFSVSTVPPASRSTSHPDTSSRSPSRTQPVQPMTQPLYPNSYNPRDPNSRSGL